MTFSGFLGEEFGLGSALWFDFVKGGEDFVLFRTKKGYKATGGDRKESWVGPRGVKNFHREPFSFL